MRTSNGTWVIGIAFMLALAGCGGSSAPGTTEALLPIATNPSTPDVSNTSGGATDAGLTEEQRGMVDRLTAAFDAGDAAAVLALWTDEDNHYRWDIEFDIAMGGRWSDIDCTATSAGQPRCELMYTNDLLTALEAPMLAGYFRLDLADGAIAAWDYDTGNRSTAAAYLQPFSDWVESTDPDAFDRMFDWNGFQFRTVESYSLWTVKAEEYLATLG